MIKIIANLSLIFSLKSLLIGTCFPYVYLQYSGMQTPKIIEIILVGLTDYMEAYSMLKDTLHEVINALSQMLD